MSPTTAAASGSPAKAARRSQDSPSVGLASTPIPFQLGEPPARLRGHMALFRRLRVVFRGRRVILFHADAAVEHHSIQEQRGREALFRRRPQMLHQLGVHRRIGGGACQYQRIAELPLRTSRLGRALVPLVGRRLVTGALGTGAEYVAEHGLALGGPTFRGFARPMERGREIGPGGGLRAEQHGGPGPRTGPTALLRTHSVQAKSGEQRLRLDISPRRRLLQPPHPIPSTGRYAGAFQVTAANAELGLGQAGARRATQKRKRPAAFALVGQSHRPP